jgi:hypothetical protein
MPSMVAKPFRRIARFLRLDYDAMLWAYAWRSANRTVFGHIREDALLMLAAEIIAIATSGSDWSQRLTAAIVWPVATIVVWWLILFLLNAARAPAILFDKERQRVEDAEGQLINALGQRSDTHAAQIALLNERRAAGRRLKDALARALGAANLSVQN